MTHHVHVLVNLWFVIFRVIRQLSTNRKHIFIGNTVVVSVTRNATRNAVLKTSLMYDQETHSHD